jgi:nitronate monooxygenase
MVAKQLRTALCDELGIEVPILLAAMGSHGKATPAELVAAVSQAGGMGFFGGSNLTPQEIRAGIRKVRSLTDRPFGVGLLLPVKLAQGPATRTGVREELAEKYPEHVAFVRGLMQEHGLEAALKVTEAVTSNDLIEEQIEIVFEEKVPAFAAGLGDPSRLMPRARSTGMKVFGLAGTVANAKRHAMAGVDIVVAQGYEAGGHTGRIASLPLVPQVIDAVAPRPVLAAGGITDGRGVAAALALGAAGAWIGTAFLVADECGIAPAMKDQIVGSRSEDFDVQRFNTGKTQRAFRNAVMQAWEKSGLAPLPWPFQHILMSDFNEAAARAGRWELHSNPAGQGGGLIKARKPAREILDELVDGTIAALQALHGRVEFRT